ncbi:hypothetical protein A2U01_0103768, partial [Trifolium medium]|nr:hypothetical protein [Trifolium medium]
MNELNTAEDFPSFKLWGVAESSSHPRSSTPNASAGSTD